MVSVVVNNKSEDFSHFLSAPSSDKYDPKLDCDLPSPNRRQSCRKLIRDAFLENPLAKFHFERTSTISDFLKLKSLPNRFSLEALITWEKTLIENKDGDPNALKRMFLIIDPKAIAKRVGLDALVWANTLTEDRPQARNIWHKKFLHEYGHSTTRLQIAAKCLTQIRQKPSDSLIALKTYDLMRFFAENTSLQSYILEIANFLRPNRSVSKESLSRFSFEGLAIKAGGSAIGNNHRYGYIPNSVKEGGVFYHFYSDAPASLVLKYNNNPIAVCSFFAISPNRLLINQLQTITPRKLLKEYSCNALEVQTLDMNRWELEPIDWKRFFVTTVAKLTKEQGFLEIGIQSANNNRWVKEGKHLSLEYATRVYDNFALQLGMRLDKDGDYYTEI